MNTITPHIIRKVAARNSQLDLYNFVVGAWPVLEPGRPLVHGWHIDAICEHLQAVTSGDIRNLIINMPPRHMKSLLVSVLWPCWEWTLHPEHRWIFASYNQQLSLRDSCKSRRLITSNWYQARYGSIYRLMPDQNQKGRFENDKTGFRLATSVSGLATGEGGDRIVVDDPHNVNQAESSLIRTKTSVWWNETMSTRDNDPKDVARVIVMQRVHEDDLSGHVLAQGGYEHLCLPAEFDDRPRHVTCIGWSDPRTIIGELLCPERYGPAEMDNLKLRMGSRGCAGQLQQLPAPAEGAIFKRSWFKNTFRELPKFTRIATFWDTAVKAGQENDESACVTVGVTTDNVACILRCRHGRWETPELVDELTAQASYLRTNFGDTYIGDYVEDKMNGSTLIQYVRRSHPQLVLIPLAVERDKVSRAQGVTPMCEAGQVLLPDLEIYPQSRTWVSDLITSLITFPTAKHDDLTDVFVYALKWLIISQASQRVSKRGRGGMV